MAEQKVFTAPLAIIKAGTGDNKKAVGYMRGIDFRQNFRRQRVTGIGRTTAIESAYVEYNATLTCDFYSIDFGKHPLGIEAILYEVNEAGEKDWENTMALQQLGLTLEILKKRATDRNIGDVDDGRDANGIIQSYKFGDGAETYYDFCKINNIFITADGFTLREGQLSGRNSSFEVLTPPLYTIGRPAQNP